MKKQVSIFSSKPICRTLDTFSVKRHGYKQTFQFKNLNSTVIQCGMLDWIKNTPSRVAKSVATKIGQVEYAGNISTILAGGTDFFQSSRSSLPWISEKKRYTIQPGSTLVLENCKKGKVDNAILSADNKTIDEGSVTVEVGGRSNSSFPLLNDTKTAKIIRGLGYAGGMIGGLAGVTGGILGSLAFAEDYSGSISSFGYLLGKAPLLKNLLGLGKSDYLELYQKYQALNTETQSEYSIFIETMIAGENFLRKSSNKNVELIIKPALNHLNSILTSCINGESTFDDSRNDLLRKKADIERAIQSVVPVEEI